MKINFYNHTKEPTKKIQELILNIFKNYKENYLMNIIFVLDDEIQDINKKYRNIDKVTDVISFALNDSFSDDLLIENEIGDIFINISQAKRQAILYDHSFSREVGFLSVHGFLHLLGYDHMNKEDEEIMFNKQKEILEKAELRR